MQEIFSELNDECKKARTTAHGSEDLALDFSVPKRRDADFEMILSAPQC